MKGILFLPWKIQVIAESSSDTEWQTRRLDGLKEINDEPDRWVYIPSSSLPIKGRFTFNYDNEERYNHQTAIIVVKSRYQVDEIVYIKEAWAPVQLTNGKVEIEYKLDGGEPTAYIMANGREIPTKWKPPLFMLERFARYFIKITGVGAERLQDITEEDAKAEGIKAIYTDNPWVWVYKFKLQEMPKEDA